MSYITGKAAKPILRLRLLLLPQVPNPRPLHSPGIPPPRTSAPPAMSAAQLLRHSRKLQSLQNVVDCERSSLARYFSTSSGSFAVKENGVEKRIGGTRFSQYQQPGKELEAFKVSLGGVNRSFTCRTPNNCIPSAFTRLNGSLSCGQVASARSFSSSAGDTVEAVVPFMGESVTDGTLATFLKKPGDRVEADEPIAQIETDKVTIDVASPEAGVIEKLIASEGDTVTPGTKVAVISKSAAPAETHVAPSEEATTKESPPAKVEEKSPKVEPPKVQAPKLTAPPKTSPTEPQLPPKERERRVPMPRLRKRIANRLKDSQNTFAMLTTFNEVDMTNLMKLRSDYKDEFVKKHGVKLGLMSCFVKAAVSGLQNQPIVNAVIDGDDIIYRDYVDVSVAVGTSKGLVVPVIRDADTMNFADIEKGINNLAKKATEGALSIDEMAGGTFTISNGGVYGSLISTPIINPPQSAILGMHSIVQRPVVVDGEILARPMMYLALTYDHRLIDGREAVFFLRRIKDVVEDPRRLLLDI